MTTNWTPDMPPELPESAMFAPVATLEEAVSMWIARTCYRIETMGEPAERLTRRHYCDFWSGRGWYSERVFAVRIRYQYRKGGRWEQGWLTWSNESDNYVKH